MNDQGTHGFCIGVEMRYHHPSDARTVGSLTIRLAPSEAIQTGAILSKNLESTSPRSMIEFELLGSAVPVFFTYSPA